LASEPFRLKAGLRTKEGRLDQPDDSISIFISYSHRDDEWRQELDTHLSGLRRQGVISVWHDRRIVAGEEWAGAIDDNLEAADVILLLISSDFIASDYCYKIEMKRALERHEAGEAVVIPVILRSCVWQIAPLKKLQALPRDAKPITSAANRDEAFTEVVNGIQDAVKKLRSGRVSSDNRLRPDRRLLPYLCDRSEQEDALAEAVLLHRQERSARPLVCLIHGDEQECHAEYLERMQYRSLRKFFTLEARRMEVKDYWLRPPRRALSAGAFWACLGQALFDDSSKAQSDIWQFIAHHEEPMMLVLELLTEDFVEPGESLLRSVIDFCGGWRDLPPGRAVILCVSLKYQRFGKTGLFDFKKKKLRQLNQSLRGLMKSLALESRAEVSVAVLPELEAIPRGDVERWKRSQQVRGLPDKQIRAWYEETDRIPMEDLAEKLKPFIEY
jgi:hypothetical protein